jgi:hypothetical protein
MLTTLIAAAIEILLVACWVCSFALDGRTLRSPHQGWYVELPLLFIVLPVVSMVVVALGGRIDLSLRFRVHVLTVSLLAINFFAFLFYLAMSGGGV